VLSEVSVAGEEVAGAAAPAESVAIAGEVGPAAAAPSPEIGVASVSVSCLLMIPTASCSSRSRNFVAMYLKM
jgi:hypothetical protein